MIVNIGSDDLSKRLQLFDCDVRCSSGDRILQALLELIYYLRDDGLVRLSLCEEGALLRQVLVLQLLELLEVPILVRLLDFGVAFVVWRKMEDMNVGQDVMRQITYLVPS